MTFDEFVSKLDGVRRSGCGIVAKCPAHDDHRPSLSVKEGARGLLVRCWAGCTVEEICAGLGLKTANLFYDALPPGDVLDHRRRTGEREQAERKAAQHQQGLKNDMLREADHLILTARGIDINTWSDARLNAALDKLGDAYEVLWEHDREHAI